MTYTSVGRTTLAKKHDPVNHSTSCAFGPYGLDCRQLNSFMNDPLAILSGLRPCGRRLNEDRVADVWLKIDRAIKLGQIKSNFTAFVRVIAKRTEAKAICHPAMFVADAEIELVSDARAETPFRVVELSDAIDHATTNLNAAGVNPDRVETVLLHLFGWSPSEIAEVQGEKVETVRKRVYRTQAVVVAELRRQFASEVA